MAIRHHTIMKAEDYHVKCVVDPFSFQWLYLHMYLSCTCILIPPRLFLLFSGRLLHGRATGEEQGVCARTT